MSKNTNTIFAAPDEGSLTEGIAGQCWASDYTTYVDKLPSLSHSSKDSNIERYCSGTKLPKEFVKQYIASNRKLSRSLLAIPVRNNNGCRWGVVVFDSQHASGIDKAETEKAFRAIINTLGVLVGDLK
jgi:archaellum biogenesis ATPase FlaH